MPKSNFKVTISVGGRFYAFYLANQLNDRGHLDKLITSYPKFEVVKYGIPKDKVSSVILKEILQRGWDKAPDLIKKLYDPTPFINNTYDHLAKRKLTYSDIFFCWPTKSLYSLREAKEGGSIVVLEHGSSHVIPRSRILSEEYKKFGLEKEGMNQKIVDKVLKEFEEADYIYVPSTFVKKSFIGEGIPEDKLIQVPFGVDLDEFKQVEKDDDVFRLIFAGGMILRKGIHYLLKAFRELDLPNSELVLLGSKSPEIEPFFDEYNVIKASEIGSGDKEIRYLGDQPQSELYKYYSQGSVFVLPSIEEGLAMVQPQAMACGLPLICTTNTGGEDIMRNGKDGFVIPIRDVETLKEKINFMYENPNIRKEMSQSAKKYIRSNFSWEDFGDRMVKEFENIIDNN